MGHYYAEMCCPDCGKIPCKCPKKPPAPDTRWMVHPSTYEVVKVADYKKTHKYYILNKFFESKKDAQVYRVELIVKEIKAYRANLDMLESLLAGSVAPESV